MDHKLELEITKPVVNHVQSPAVVQAVKSVKSGLT